MPLIQCGYYLLTKRPSAQLPYIFFPFLPIAISANPVQERERASERKRESSDTSTGTNFWDICPFHVPLNSFLCAGGRVVVWPVAGFTLANAEYPFHTFREMILRDGGPSGGCQASEGNHNPLIRAHRMPQFTRGRLLVHSGRVKSLHHRRVNCRFNLITLCKWQKEAAKNVDGYVLDALGCLKLPYVLYLRSWQ